MSLTKKIEKMLFEDTWNQYGSEYMSHPYDQKEPEAFTIQPELPIAASAQADMQLTDSMPPVDDEEYVPQNNKELASAFAALALKVPDRLVSDVYEQVKKLANGAEEQGFDQAPDEEPEELEERFRRFWKSMLHEAKDDAEEFEEFRRGMSREDWEAPDDFYNVPEDEKLPDVIQGKYIAQYYRDRPGKDPEKAKGSGESTMVTASGRLLQNVVKPLIDVPKDQLSDAAEYLRLQFRMLMKDTGKEIPREAPRTFSGMYFKKLVPKLSDEQLGQNFLNTVVTDYKRRSGKWLDDLRDKALAEVESEASARAKLKATLAKEDPKQAELMDELL
jgi:hypothetical protein